MAPDWTPNWTVAEAHDILLHGQPRLQAELPIDRVEADTRMNTVWDNLTDDCKAVLCAKREEFQADVGIAGTGLEN